jgi:Kinesin motor domain
MAGDDDSFTLPNILACFKVSFPLSEDQSKPAEDMPDLLFFIQKDHQLIAPNPWVLASVYVLLQWFQFCKNADDTKKLLDLLKATEPSSVYDARLKQSIEDTRLNPFTTPLRSQFLEQFDGIASDIVVSQPISVGTDSRRTYDLSRIFTKLLVVKTLSNLANMLRTTCLKDRRCEDEANNDCATVYMDFFKRAVTAVYLCIQHPTKLANGSVIRNIKDMIENIGITKAEVSQGDQGSIGDQGSNGKASYSIKWLYKEAVVQQRLQADKAFTEPVARALFYNSVVALRQSFLMYTNACMNIHPDRDKFLVHDFTRRVNPCYQKRGGKMDGVECQQAQKGHQRFIDLADAITKSGHEYDNSHFSRNRVLLSASLLNCMLIDRVFFCLPWVAKMFSVDNLAAAMKTIEERMMWQQIFFVRVADYIECIKEYTGSEASANVTTIINLDTTYVRRIINQDWSEIKVPDFAHMNAANTVNMYISRHHLCTILLTILRINHLQFGTDMIDKSYVKVTASYLDQYLLSVHEFSKALNALKILAQKDSSGLFSKSHTSLLTYVRIWAAGKDAGKVAGDARDAPQPFLKRHAIMYVPHTSTQHVDDAKEFIVQYASDLRSIDHRAALGAQQATLESMANSAEKKWRKLEIANEFAQKWFEENVDDVADYEYDQAYSFGPFTRTFANSFRTRNDLVAKGTHEVVHHLENLKSVVVMGFGISGAGKTSTLVYLRQRSSESLSTSQNVGVVIHWLNELKKDKGFFPGGKVWFSAVQFYKTSITDMREPLDSKKESSQSDEGKSDDNEKPNLMAANLEAIVQNNWASVDVGSDSAGKSFEQKVAEEVIKFVEHPSYRHTKPTSNNDSSSRSHVILSFLITKADINDKATLQAEMSRIGQGDSTSSCLLHVVDLAGVENAFNPKVPAALELFKDPSKQDATCISKSYRDRLGALAVLRGLRTKSDEDDKLPIPCSCIERYLFNELYPYSYYTTDGYDKLKDAANQGVTTGLDTSYLNKGGLKEDEARARMGIENYRRLYLGIGALDKRDGTLECPGLPIGSVTYLHSQIWGSVLMNPCAIFEQGNIIKVPIPLFPSDKPEITVLQGLCNYMHKKRLAVHRTGGYIFDILASKTDENPPVLSDSAKRGLSEYWAEPFQKKDLTAFLASASRATHNHWGHLVDFLSLEAGQKTALPLFCKRGDSPDDNANPIWNPWQLFISDAPLKKDRGPAGWTKLTDIGKIMTKFQSEGYTLLNPSNVEQIFLQPRFVPFLRPMAIAAESYNGLGVYDFHRLEAIRHRIIHTTTCTPAQVAGDICSVLSMFGKIQDMAFKELPAYIVELSFSDTPVVQDRDSELEAGPSFCKRLKAFVQFFMHSTLEEQQRLYAYICMVYEFIEYTLTNKGGGLDEQGSQPYLRDINEWDRIKSADNIQDTFICDHLIRNCIPAAMFALNSTIGNAASKTVMEKGWNYQEAGDKIIRVEDGVHRKGNETGRAHAISTQRWLSGDTGFTSREDLHKAQCSFEDRPEKFSLFRLERCKELFTDTRDVLMFDNRVLNLPVDAVDPPIKGIRQPTARSYEDLGDYSDPPMTEQMLEQVAFTIMTANKLFKWGMADWIHYLFLFGQLVGRPETINPEIDRMMNDFTANYMTARTEEGIFINRTVSAMKNSMLNLVTAQSQAINPYGNPETSPVSSLFGCHPVLDRECFKGESRLRKTSELTDDMIVAPDDHVFGHIHKYHKDKLNTLQLAIIAVVNLSVGVQDPPNVPYVNATTLSHAFRLHNLMADGTNFFSLVDPASPFQFTESAPKGASGTGEVTLHYDSEKDRVYNPVGLDILPAEDIISNVRRGLKNLSANIKRAGASATLRQVLEWIQLVLTKTRHADKDEMRRRSRKRMLDANITSIIAKIILEVQHYNTASLIGNLNFVESLRKRGIDEIADVKTRTFKYDYLPADLKGSAEGEAWVQQRRLFNIDLPMACSGVNHPQQMDSLLNISTLKQNMASIIGATKTRVGAATAFYQQMT